MSANTDINANQNVNQIDATDEVIDAQPPNAPVQNPRRSSRIVIKTADKSDGVTQSTCLKDAIQQSKESAQRLAAERLEKKSNKSTQPHNILILPSLTTITS